MPVPVEYTPNQNLYQKNLYERNYASQRESHESGSIIAGYQVCQKLGSGSFATVYKARKIDEDSSSDGQSMRYQYAAIKAIERTSKKITKKVLENLDLEISILASYKHPNIVGLHQVHKTDHHFYLILEYCAGGDLQRLIRSRKSGRLTERLARRLMRDLTAGLTFLANHNLIHRDIKPQNLLLTGPLPLDEDQDPCQKEEETMFINQINFPSDQFHLKIADFGFARHLQKSSLADTLCGSPLYMAPEILQQRRYDNKADLWSAGTVLFEMVVGKPPFHGENHIDLLRNIQQKAVRLPPDLKVSGELVKLLRLLLNRSPSSRAGFNDFVAASDAFVSLGCNGSPATVVSESSNFSDTSIITAQPQLGLKNLGPISEVEESKLNEKQIPKSIEKSTKISPTTQPMIVPTSPNLIPLQNSFHGVSQVPNGNVIHQLVRKGMNSHFTPLEPSPPGPKQIGVSDRLPSPFNLKSVNEWQNCNHYLTSAHQIQRNQGESIRMLHSVNDSHLDQHQSSRNIHPSTTSKKGYSSQNSDDSCGGSGFVMVEKGSANINATTSPISFLPSDEKTISTTVNMWKQTALNVVPASVLSGNSTKVSPPISPRSKYFNALSSRNLIPPAIPFLKKGMLSTSPGAGNALVGLMGNSKDIHPLSTDVGHIKQNETIYLDKATKILSAADDVGRRAINVAHVGDVRAYLAMRLIISNENKSLQTTFDPMESVEEESQNKTLSFDDSTPSNRVRTISVDLSIQRRNSNCSTNDEDDEMPFAMPLEEHSGSTLSNLLAVREVDNCEDDNRSKCSEVKCIPTSASILAHFREALSCYIKTLSMLRSSVNACQQLLSQMEVQNRGEKESFNQFKTRCEVSYRWLSGQFKGVLERADAANSEISKITKDSNNLKESLFGSHALSVEELVYNHSLACGKDGAIKQLLGQYETARSCYRSAGLLAETLLMDPKLVKEDKRILEDYVQGFSERIYEIDYIMLQQNRQSSASSITSRGGVMESIHYGRNAKSNLVLGEQK